MSAPLRMPSLALLPAVLFAACGASGDNGAATSDENPTFQVDPTWPNPMPNDWKK